MRRLVPDTVSRFVAGKRVQGEHEQANSEPVSTCSRKQGLESSQRKASRFRRCRGLKQAERAQSLMRWADSSRVKSIRQQLERARESSTFGDDRVTVGVRGFRSSGLASSADGRRRSADGGWFSGTAGPRREQ